MLMLVVGKILHGWAVGTGAETETKRPKRPHRAFRLDLKCKGSNDFESFDAMEQLSMQLV